ncbi:hypothetical protein [Kitasatospora griseola]|uniref:hypothetical protein n=1 Tax=Kitasatospora griseola TaxID=2064 RepID=UPI003819AC06
MPKFVHRVTKYDPANRDERGHYLADDVDSDRGPIEAAYLRAVVAFAEECGVDRLSVRGPGAFLLEPDEAGMRLEDLLPSLGDFHDGAEVPLEVALELVRMMLRGDEGRCLLEAGDEFFVHIGYDQYMYIGTGRASVPRPVPAGSACSRSRYRSRPTRRSPRSRTARSGPPTRRSGRGCTGWSPPGRPASWRSRPSRTSPAGTA